MSVTSVIVVSEPGYELSGFAGADVKLAFADLDAMGEVLAELGGDVSRTWVVTPSADAFRAAHELGLHVCAVLPEGVALAQGGLENADIIAHGWREVTFELLDDYADRATGDTDSVCRTLIVSGSPEVSSPELVNALANGADYVVACDAGANVCRSAGVVPHAFVGDGDSIDAETLAWVRSVADRHITFPSEKYATDLALAIDAARHEAARRSERLELTLTCASGGRPDHALAVVGLLASAADASPRMVEDGFELRILSPDGAPVWQPGDAALGCTLSVVSLAPDTVVSEHGLRWELNERVLPLLGDEGISNVVTSTCPEVICHSGTLAVYLLLSH